MAITINGSGTITGISAGGLPDGSVSTADLADGAVTDAKINGMSSSKLSGALPAIDGSALTGISGGKVAQVVTGQKTDIFMLSGLITYFYNIVSVTITPSATSSKILLSYHGNWGGGDDVTWQLKRNTTPIGIGDTNGSRTQCTSAGGARHAYEMASTAGVWLDSPATTSAITYYLACRHGGGVTYINRGPFDENATHQEVGVTSIVAQEILA